MSTTLNIALFGIGNVGSTLIDQVIAFNKRKSDTLIHIFAIANSRKVLFNTGELLETWKVDFDQNGQEYTATTVTKYAKATGISNLIAVDVTASSDFVENYIPLIKHGFHIVTANKIANTLSYKFYSALRETLNSNNREFFYETNVGAGLPVIETIKNLYQSGEQIHKIRGVFSGSLSYLFNTFSKEEKPFSEVLLEADALGLTEPDAREDLSGNDVARKLLILSREVGLQNEFDDIDIQSLVPPELNGTTTLPQFRESIKTLDTIFTQNKKELSENEVLRHVGELDVISGTMDVKLIQEPKHTALGQTQGTDAVFEIYIDAYGAHPLVIQGAGAGKAVTARGVLSDIIRVAQQVNA